MFYFRNVEISQHNILQNDLAFFLDYFWHCCVSKVYNIGFGAQGHVRKPPNHDNEGSPITKSRSYQSKVKQNNSTELLAISFPSIHHTNCPQMQNNHLNMFAIFQPYFCSEDISYSYSGHHQHLDSGTCLTSNRTTAARYSSSAATNVSTSENRRQISREFLECIVNHGKIQEIHGSPVPMFSKVFQMFYFRNVEISQHNILQNDLAFFLDYFWHCCVSKVYNIGFGAQGHVRKPPNHDNEGSPITKSRSYQSKVKQNNSTELLAISFPSIHHTNCPQMQNNHLNMFAIFQPYFCSEDISYSYSGHHQHLDSGTCLTSNRTTAARYSSSAATNVSTSENRRQISREFLECIVNHWKIQEIHRKRHWKLIVILRQCS